MPGQRVKVELWIYWLIYDPALSRGCELWVVTDRIRLRMQALNELRFLHRVSDSGMNSEQLVQKQPVWILNC